jgi:hypothetical protein
VHLDLCELVEPVGIEHQSDIISKMIEAHGGQQGTSPTKRQHVFPDVKVREYKMKQLRR